MYFPRPTKCLLSDALGPYRFSDGHGRTSVADFIYWLAKGVASGLSSLGGIDGIR